jgi:hypothetical protein
MKVSEAFPSKYISAADIPEENIRLVMSHVVTETMEDKQKLILYFQGAKKGLVLNKTNAKNIADEYGDDTDDWTGKEVILFTTWVDFQGKSVEAVRVRTPQPKDNKSSAAKKSDAPLNDTIPF